jgi:hypothetical protein
MIENDRPQGVSHVFAGGIQIGWHQRRSLRSGLPIIVPSGAVIFVNFYCAELLNAAAVDVPAAVLQCSGAGELPGRYL